MMSGAAIIYKTKYQKAVTLSSTEAEFISAAETGKMILYTCSSLLNDLGIAQETPTQLHVDNMGAVFTISSQAPTKRTRHVDIKYFALLDWSELKQLSAMPIATDHNISDSTTKPIGRIKFHQHADIYMGRVTPTHVTQANPHLAPATLNAMQHVHRLPFSGCSPTQHYP